MNIISIIKTIKEYWVIITFLSGVLVAIFTFGKSMIEATKCSLRNDILDIYDRAVAKGKIKQYDRQGNLIKEWNSQKEASKQLRLNQGSISNCCTGKAPTAYGYVWKFS